MAKRVEIWTCPTCGARAAGSGEEGLWPPDGWQLAETDNLLARCPSHHVEQPPEQSGGSLAESVRWFGTPGL